jgi:hypothetical protein
MRLPGKLTVLSMSAALIALAFLLTSTMSESSAFKTVTREKFGYASSVVSTELGSLHLDITGKDIWIDDRTILEGSPYEVAILILANEDLSRDAKEIILESIVFLPSSGSEVSIENNFPPAPLRPGYKNNQSAAFRFSVGNLPHQDYTVKITFRSMLRTGGSTKYRSIDVPIKTVRDTIKTTIWDRILGI